jgi:hypothetical protein
MRLSFWFINPGNVIFTEANGLGWWIKEVNQFKKSIIVLLNDSKIPLIIHFKFNETKHIDSEISTNFI